MTEIAVESLMDTPDGRDEFGHDTGPRDPETEVYCESCGYALPWGAPAEEHDHDYAGPIKRYHADGTVEEVDG